MSRVDAKPNPSKRWQRRQRQANDRYVALLVAAIAQGNPRLREIARRQVEILNSPGVRYVTRSIGWWRPLPLASGMVTWPTRRRRHRRTR